MIIRFIPWLRLRPGLAASSATIWQLPACWIVQPSVLAFVHNHQWSQDWLPSPIIGSPLTTVHTVMPNAREFAFSAKRSLSSVGVNLELFWPIYKKMHHWEESISAFLSVFGALSTKTFHGDQMGHEKWWFFLLKTFSCPKVTEHTGPNNVLVQKIKYIS